MKRCSRCNTEKEDHAFGKNSSKKDGLTTYCKECIKSYYIVWDNENPESRKKAQKKYRENNKEKTFQATKKWRKENREKVNLIKRVWRFLNRERINEQKRELYKKNKDFILARQREKAWYKTERARETSKKWREENKERIRVSNRNRKSALKNVAGSLSLEEWQEIKDMYGNKCLCCGRSDVKLTIDHVVPIKLGGSNTADNIQPLCGSCNSRKNTKIEDYR